MKLKDVPAAQQASLLYHQRVKVVYDAKRSRTEGHPVVRFYLSTLDTKLAHLRAKLNIGAPRQPKKRRRQS